MVNIIKSSYIKDRYLIKAKSSFSKKNKFMAEIVFSNTNKDKDGDKIPYTTLLTNLVGMKADLEHANLDNIEELDKSNLFTVIESFFDGTNHIGLVEFNSEHKQFDNIWENIGRFGASFEYKLKDENQYEIVGLSGTFDPRNEGAKVINAYIEG